MKSVSSRFWTRVAVSISYGDNHYTTGTSIIKGGDIRFITDMGGTGARDDRCVGVAIKCNTHNSQLNFSILF